MLSEKKVYEIEFKNQTPEELNFLYDLPTLQYAARLFGIKGISKMNKIVLCLNIEQYLIDKGINYSIEKELSIMSLIQYEVQGEILVYPGYEREEEYKI